jgi:hypothetical protein
MNIPENREALQHLVIQYLYGDLSDVEVRQFEAEIESNTVLRDLLEEEQRFDSAIPLGIHPQVDEDRIQGNRWLLRQTLQKESRPRFSLRQWLQSLSERPLSVAFQGAAMAMTFVLGILVATPEGISTNLPTGMPLGSNEVTPLELINAEDYEIYQLQVNDYDANSGEIDLSFSLASETRLMGNVSDVEIQGLMAVALQDDIDSASRLDTINALQPVVSGNDVYEALIYVLQNDQNPGVRYQAVTSLVSLAHEENVRDALRFALSEDVNQGVRIEAFNALTNYRDEETLAVFRQQMDEDSSEYIRAQSRSIVEELDGSDLIL